MVKANSSSPTTEDDSEYELSSEQKEIEGYILRSFTEELPIEVLRTLSNDDLCYIRNGIYAYNGCYFYDNNITNYYKKLSWYKCNIESRFFKEDYLNFFNKIILNIYAPLKKSEIVI